MEAGVGNGHVPGDADDGKVWFFFKILVYLNLILLLKTTFNIGEVWLKELGGMNFILMFRRIDKYIGHTVWSNINSFVVIKI